MLGFYLYTVNDLINPFSTLENQGSGRHKRQPENQVAKATTGLLESFFLGEFWKTPPTREFQFRSSPYKCTLGAFGSCFRIHITHLLCNPQCRIMW